MLFARRAPHAGAGALRRGERYSFGAAQRTVFSLLPSSPLLPLRPPASGVRTASSVALRVPVSVSARRPRRHATRRNSSPRAFSGTRPADGGGETADPFGEEKEAVTRVGVYANVMLAVTKSGVGLLSGSVALLADGLHSFSDLASDVVTLGVLRIANKPADSRYPWGYGRFDALGTLAVSGLLIGGSCAIGINSLQALVAATSDPATVLEVSALAQGQYAAPALLVAAASVGVKEWLYRKTLAVGQKARSNVVVANAWHHRSDALSSVIAMAGIAGAIAGVPALDTCGGILVSAMILKAGAGMAWDAVQELSDASVQRDVVDRIHTMTASLNSSSASAAQAAEQQDEDIKGVHNIRARRMGHYTIVDLHVEVDPQLSISMAYAAAARLRDRVIAEIPEVIDVSTHLEPYNPKEHARVHLGRVDRLRRGMGATTTNMNPRHKWLNTDDGLHTGARSTRSQAQVSSELRDVIAKLPLQVELTHLTCHYLEDQLTVEVSLLFTDDDVTIAEARAMAADARRHILECVEGVADVDLHLEI